MKKWITALALVIGLLAAALLVGPTPASAQPIFVIPSDLCICMENSDRDTRLDLMAACSERTDNVSYIQPVPPTWMDGIDWSWCGPCPSESAKYWVCLIMTGEWWNK